MKFTDGFWHAREGYVLHHPMEIRDVAAGPGTLRLVEILREHVAANCRVAGNPQGQ